MFRRSLKSSFLKYCEEQKFEKNINQIKIINSLSNFLKPKKLFNFFDHQKKLCFYLTGDVGVGKTMILNYFYTFLKVSKKKIHFNQFMIDFHNYRYKNKKINKGNTILDFVKKLKKKYKLIYLDEFQVTNIVDAMILGKLFEIIFQENMKIIISSNTEIINLYKDGLQRKQFLPFISIIQKYSIQKRLIINSDYRKLGMNKLQRAFFPISEKNVFKINSLFREMTKNKIKKKLKLNIKGRNFIILNYYEGIARFNFAELCDDNVGAEDYLEISKFCKFIIIDNIPKFNDENSNQQNRFITLIDILYDKKIPLMISLSSNPDNLGSSIRLNKTFTRTLSRLYELTSPKINL